MSLEAVGIAVDAGHVGGGFTKNKDATLKVSEIPTVCKKCHTPWPCSTIVRARAKVQSSVVVRAG